MPQRPPRPILIVTGMAKERRIARGPGLVSILSGGDTARLGEILDRQRGSGWGAVLSFGIAGGLDPALHRGDVVVARAIVDGVRRWPVDTAIADLLAGLLLGGGVPAKLADIAGVDQPLVQRADKETLRRETGAAAADMESHMAAAFAAEQGVPFGAVRVVCDPAGRSLPPLAGAALSPDGRVNRAAILASLARHPGQLLQLPGLALDASAAFAGLRRCRNLLRIRRGLPDLRKLLGDVS